MKNPRISVADCCSSRISLNEINIDLTNRIQEMQAIIIRQLGLIAMVDQLVSSQLILENANYIKMRLSIYEFSAANLGSTHS